MKTTLDQINDGALIVNVSLAPGYCEDQGLSAQIQRRSNWRNELIALAQHVAKTSWIRVEDELPNHEEVVDIYLKDTRICNVTYFNYKNDEQFFDADFDDIYKISEVMFWMRPPSPPDCFA